MSKIADIGAQIILLTQDLSEEEVLQIFNLVIMHRTRFPGVKVAKPDVVQEQPSNYEVIKLESPSLLKGNNSETKKEPSETPSNGKSITLGDWCLERGVRLP